MPKPKTVFICSQCGTQAPKWQGQCASCNAWNTLSEEALPQGNTGRAWTGGSDQIISLSEVNVSELLRIEIGSTELSRVLGGGLVSGSVVLLGGDPGIGKSTLLLQTVAALSQSKKILYVSGEESLSQIRLRSERLSLSAPELQLMTCTQVETILEKAVSLKPDILVIDSIQTMQTSLVNSAPGSVSQVRESAGTLVRYAKDTGTSLFLIGHVTKEGALAGPRVLEHMVDAVLYFEGESDSRYRLLRAVKNRFGAVNELGVFAMTEQGLKDVSHPSAIFLSRSETVSPGTVVMVTWEGTRPLLVEVQALVDETHLSNPRRVAVGLDQNRLALLLAVLHRHAQIITYDQDVFLNVTGGIRITETASDLAVIAAVVSSLRNRALEKELLIFGELGLGGEIRPIAHGQERLKEAVKHGFKRAIIPKANAPRTSIAGLTIHPVAHLKEALQQILVA